MGERGKRTAEGEVRISPEITQKPDLAQRMIDDAHFVQIKSFQEYVFNAKREGNRLKPNNGYKYSSAEDNPHEEIRQIQSVIKRYGGPQESNWDEDKFGRLYVASYPSEDSWIIWGGGRIGKDFVGRNNDISFQIQLQDVELASEFMKAIRESPTPTLQMFMSRVFVNEQGQQLLPTDKVRTQHRQYMDPFLVPIAEVKAVEIKKPESRPAVVENHQPPDYNLTVSEVQRNAPPPAEALTPPERRYGVLIAPMAEGRNDKVAAGKPQGVEGQIIRGGDDCVFSIKAPDNNLNGLMCFGADLDGVSQGGRGDEASIVAARSLYPDLNKFLNDPNLQLTRDQIEIQVAEMIAKAHAKVNARLVEMSQNPLANGLDENVLMTTLSLFALQESDGKLYLHTWNTGDSLTLAYVKTDDGKDYLYPVTISDDIAGKSFDSAVGTVVEYQTPSLKILSKDPTRQMTIEQRQQKYKQISDNLVASAGLGILRFINHAVGENGPAIVNYERIELPHIGEKYKGARVAQVKVAAYSDGIERYAEFDKQLQAFRRPSANGAAMALLDLGRAADADDRSVVAAEVAQTKEIEALSVEETSAISAIEVMVGLEKTLESLDREKLKECFLQARLTFGKLPQASRVRTEIMKNVNVQLGAEAERLRKAGKPEAEIFEEWLKRVFIPLYKKRKI